MITFIIPFHQIIPELFYCIESISSQLDIDDEIILVGDGIDVDIFASLKFSKFSGEIKMFNIPKQGANSAREFGLSKVTNEYVVFHDYDDLLPSGTVTSYKEIIAVCMPDIIVGNILQVNEKGVNKKIYHFIREARIIYKDQLTIRELKGFPTNIVAKAIRIGLLSNIKFDNSSMFQDWNISAKVFLQASTFYFSNEIFYNYVLRNSSTSSYQSNSVDNLLNAFSSYNGIKTYFNKGNFGVVKQNLLYFRIITLKYFFNLLYRNKALQSENVESKINECVSENLSIHDVISIYSFKFCVMYFILKNRFFRKLFWFM